jgi:hypothetical protein
LSRSSEEFGVNHELKILSNSFRVALHTRGEHPYLLLLIFFYGAFCNLRDVYLFTFLKTGGCVSFKGRV